ncbi:Stf0 family sulfotransferase [Actibacterium sp. MT2.3-13A]|uniref:Stf0 family sulfotransferase n=1 Tax=Actibacterium sp. MT2.3-13A TaxID=2828332 RepID=UPI001BA8A36C|nr:Stf0 family sulfotransferase [Actibacterium sp. MT2.3-13A]
MGTEQESGQKGANRRFVIMGLPRSGTTYLMTLLNAHRDIYCSGEQFNPHAIIGPRDRNDRLKAITRRDREAVPFMNSFFARHEAEGYARVGFKFMIGHNIRVLRRLEQDTGITLIYVHRKNKLAQVSSLIKAAQSQKWAQHRADSHVSRKIKAGPRQISHRWHEYATFDHLFMPWFEARPHHKIALEYREMFAPGFEARICDFLGVAPDPGMKSPLVKQGSNRILDRFEEPEKIEAYFRELGLAAWLETEL